MWQCIRVIAGFGLVIAGVIGLFLPLAPGSILLMAGVALVGIDHPRIRPLMEPLKRWRARLQGTSQAMRGGQGMVDGNEPSGPSRPRAAHQRS
jgi:hypothetical protein